MTVPVGQFSTARFATPSASWSLTEFDARRVRVPFIEAGDGRLSLLSAVEE